MADYEASFEGMDKLIQRIQDIGKMTEAKKIVRESTVNVARRSQEVVSVGWGQRYPTKTPKPKGYSGGTLKRSMVTNNTDYKGEVKYTSDYAAYQEYGTRYQTARKYVGKPYNSEKMKFINKLRRLAN
ncbi:HK97-gp10 family putative phage morphogenesis protein [Leuconostoc citreum]|uniref:HK97-gp10 family putative phage morphogenesis protein n=1 Tax=Leuconostoc citreum TaxID=33964 RepID=UPI0032DE41A6